MIKSTSTVQLFALRQDRRGNIHLSATRAFFEVLRSKMEAAVGPTLRIGSFDFLETKKNTFVGIPDERNEASMREAHQIANRILMSYRAILLFEAVFIKEGSYENFVLFNRRSPNQNDLKELGQAQGVKIPFMDLPYKEVSDSSQKNAVVRDVPSQKSSTTFKVKTTLPKVVDTLTSVSLEALAKRFAGKSNRKQTLGCNMQKSFVPHSYSFSQLQRLKSQNPTPLVPSR